MNITSETGAGRNWRAIRALSLALLLTCAARPAYADLSHLFTFNDGTASDSIGNAHGDLLGATFVDDDGILHLPGANADFVTLDGPAINIASYTDVTFEAWFTVNQFITWERVFDFGDRTVDPAEQGYIYYTPQGGNGAGLAVYATGGARTEAPHGTLQTGQLYHLAMVIDDDVNGGTDTMSVYLDGALQTSVGHSRSLSDVGTTFAYLGESLVGDPNFNGTMDEFRISDHAMTLTQVQSSFTAGPTVDTIPNQALRLVVNTVTGSVEMVGNAANPVVFDYYLVESDNEALDPAGWLSLSDQGVDSIGPGTGESWVESAASDSSGLFELYLLGASAVDNGERIDLGHAFDPSVFGQGNDGDLSFNFARQGSSRLGFGDVIYITPEPLDGDYNEDFTVNAADYTVWRNTLGSEADLRADGDGDGRIDRDDYVIWKWNYGNADPMGTGAAEASSAVPEPTVAVLIVMALLGSACLFGRRSI